MKYKTRLYDIRRAKRMTQQQLADAAGVSKTMIGNYETGRNNITVKRAQQFAAILNVEWTKLYETPEV